MAGRGGTPRPAGCCRGGPILSFDHSSATISRLAGYLRRWHCHPHQRRDLLVPASLQGAGRSRSAGMAAGSPSRPPRVAGAWRRWVFGHGRAPRRGTEWAGQPIFFYPWRAQQFWLFVRAPACTGGSLENRSRRRGRVGSTGGKHSGNSQQRRIDGRSRGVGHGL